MAPTDAEPRPGAVTMDDILSEGASAAPQRVARHGGRNRGTNEGSVRMAQRAGAGRGVSVSSRSEGAARVQRGRQGQRRRRSFVWAAEAWMWRTAKRRMSIDASSRVGPAGAAAGTYRFWVPLYAQKASTKQADTIWSARRGAIVLPPPPVRVSWASILTDGRQRKRFTGEPRGIILSPPITHGTQCTSSNTSSNQDHFTARGRRSMSLN